MPNLKHGDFTTLAVDYAKYRPGYSSIVLATVFALLPKNPIVADIGAGTGVWSRQLAEAGAEVHAVEPNDAMRSEGMRTSVPNITWSMGSAESSALASMRFDLVTMASSLHWTDLDSALGEFSRILKPGGYFLALWNTRMYASNPLLADIENYLSKLKPGLRRVSSGRGDFCEQLTSRLRSSALFADLLYLEGFHSERQSPAHYLGVWGTANDVRVQLGEELFNDFSSYIKQRVSVVDHIDAEYKTRAWLIRKIS